MPRNGQGVYSPPTNSFNPAVTGQDALPEDWNATLADLSDAMSDSIDAGGTTTVTANIPMNGKVFTTLGAGAARTQSVNLGQAQDGAMSYAVASGTDTYTADLTPAITGYTTGATYKVLIGNANTVTNPTLNLNSLGAKAIVGLNGSAVAIGQIQAALYYFTYDGTNFRVSAVDYSAVAQLAVANVFTADQTIRKSDDSADAGPQLILDRLSASPAANDLLGFIPFSGRDSAGNITTYGQVMGRIVAATDGAEEGQVLITVAIAGVPTEKVTVTAQGMSINGAVSASAGLSGNALGISGNGDFGGDVGVDGTLIAAHATLPDATVNGLSALAPRPSGGTGTAIGDFYAIAPPGSTTTLPGTAGQQWAFIYGLGGSNARVGVAAGGTSISTPDTGQRMLVWRVA